MLNGWALHLHSCSSSASLTYLQIRGSAHVLTTQTNLYKLQLFYLFTLKSYTYVLRPITILIYVTVTYLCFHVSSFPLYYHLYVPSSTFVWWPSLPSNLFLLYFYLYRIYECWLHSCPVRWEFNLGEGKHQVSWHMVMTFIR